MGGGGVPKPLNTVQLQQLSAQIKAYRLLARNSPIPDALLSIAHGRKPTPAMIAQMYNQNVSKGASFPQQPSMSSQPSQLSQSQRAGSAGNITSLASSQPVTPSQTGDSSGAINMYPPSPGVSQSHSPSTSQPKSSHSSTSMTVAPNVTLPPGGELPLPVKQAMSSAQSVGTSTQPPHTMPHSSAAPPPSVSVPISSSQQSHPPTQQQMTQQSQQQQQQTKQGQMVKPVKLTPMTKPQGVDPTIVIQERETRCGCNVCPSLSFLLRTYTTMYLYIYLYVQFSSTHFLYT